jgi:hypothetical protein
LRFAIKDRGTPITGYGKLDVRGGATPRVVSFGLRAIPPCDMSTLASKARVVKSLGSRESEVESIGSTTRW